MTKLNQTWVRQVPFKERPKAKGRKVWNKGKKMSEDWIRKNKESHIGIKHSEEWKEKMRKIAKERGFGKWMKGRTGELSYQWKGGKEAYPRCVDCGKLLSTPNYVRCDLCVRKYRVGENHPNWKGGISYEEYSVDWKSSLKISIRERDHYTCQVCGEKQGDVTHHVHHIDYIKTNCNPENLVTLCVKCHMKTNYNREYWKKYFTR